MCGIAGIISVSGKPVEPQAIKRMCDVQAHRGPDDAGYAFFRLPDRNFGEGGYWCEFADSQFHSVNEHLPYYGGQFFRDEMSKHEFCVALGHRRLSIIDLTHYGHQPMANSDRRYWVTFNGEIYNFPVLRDELRAAGHIFRTRSDTEVLLHLWEQYGEDGINRLNGMFAFAIYDRIDNKLVITSDRFGVKPVYYAFLDGIFVFASEIKGILASGTVKAEIDPEAMIQYFTFQNLYGEKTLFKHIKLLQPGRYVTVYPGSRETTTSLSSFHDAFPRVDPSLKDGSDMTKQLADSFATSVNRQLISDVEVGSYLSGGMDSGSIVAVAGRSIPRLHTFTGGFDLTNVDGIEQGFDERKLAEELSYHLQTEHYAVVLHAGDMPAAMEQITWHVDDPRVGMCHQNWYVAKLASKFVKVCLAGAGGDELFGGYPWRYRQVLQARSPEEFNDSYFRYWHRLVSKDELPLLFVSDMWPHIPSAWESFVSVIETGPGNDPELTPLENRLQQVLDFEFKTFMRGFLVIEDRVSMAHGLETRVPFLDNDLADLAWKIPPLAKVNAESLMDKNQNGHINTVEGKLILRKAMEAFLPRSFTRQRKQGFSPPDENWYRGPSMDYIKTIMFDSKTLQRPWFENRFVKDKLMEHFKGQRNHRLLIWSLMSFEWLQRHFVDQTACSKS